MLCIAFFLPPPLACPQQLLAFSFPLQRFLLSFSIGGACKLLSRGPPPSKFLLVILCVVPAGSLHLLLCGEREGCCFFIMLSLHIALCAVCCVFSILCALHSVLSTLQSPVAAPFLAFSSSARETRNSKLETRDGRFGKREDFGFYRSS